LELNEAARPEDTKVARTLLQSLWLQKNKPPSFMTKQRSPRVLVLAEKIDIPFVAVTTTVPGQQLFAFLVAGFLLPPRKLADFQRVEYVILHFGHLPNLCFVLVEGIITRLKKPSNV